MYFIVFLPVFLHTHQSNIAPNRPQEIVEPPVAVHEALRSSYLFKELPSPRVHGGKIIRPEKKKDIGNIIIISILLSDTISPRELSRQKTVEKQRYE